MHFIHEHVSGARIIFGLDWSPLIGGHPEHLGQQRARMMDATHYVLTGNAHGCALGIVRIEETIKNASPSVHSAAAIFSKKFPHGAQACLMTMTDGACWMLVCHAGTVLSHTDRWYADESQALDAIEPIRQRFPALQLHREVMHDAPHWPVWLNAALAEDSVLKRVRYSRLGARKWLCLMLSIVVTGGAAAYQFLYKSDTRNDALPVNTENVWRQSLREQSAHTVWHSYSQLKSVIDSWMNIPLLPMGWRLTKIQCEPAGHGWSCSARFIRQHRLAMNSHLEQVKPIGWQADFSPLEDAAFIWRVDAGVATLDLDQPWMRMDWMSYLQRVGVAYEHIQIGQAVLSPIKAPLDSQGLPLAKPSVFPDWTQRTLVFKAPLRSFASLERFYMPVRWRRVVLSVDHQAPQAIHRSVLTFELIGDMYESKAQ